MVKKLSLLLCLLCSAGWIQAATFTVSNTNATNVPGSLCKAIADANAAGTGPHLITFTITGGTISNNNSALYVITNSGITIDAGGKPIIFTGAAGITFGFTIQGNNTTIKGLTFTNFSSACIRVMTVTGTKITGCRFGTTVDGASSTNTTIGYGIYGNGATDLYIGGSTAADRNYFADATTRAVYIYSSTNVVITGNYFGLSGTNTLYADKNAGSIYLGDCINSFIGKNSAGERNLFANSTDTEVEIAGFTGYGNTISGNYFGYAANGTTQVTYNNGIYLNNAKDNLIMFNKFGGTYANPFRSATSYVGNKLKQNSFESHSGTAGFPGMSANVTTPMVYAPSSTIIKGKSAPGDSIEIYYSNSYAISGLTFIAATKSDANGDWKITGTFTTGKYISVTATNNANHTTSWFYTDAVNATYACANTPTVYTNNICNYPTVATNGIYPSGSVGTTKPTNAGQWSSSGTGTFTNGGLYTPSITKYMPSAADLSSGSVTFRLITTDTNCINTTAGASAATNFLPLPTVAVGSDQYSCSSNIFALSATPAYFGNSSFYTNWTSLDAPGNVSFSSTTADAPTATFSAAGTYRIIRSVGSLPYYCSNTDTLVVTYKPTPTAPGGTLTTFSQVPVTYAVPSAVGETLTAFSYAGSISPASSIVTTNLNTLTYTSTGAYYGPASYTYYVQNQCGGTSTLGTVSVTVKNAPPVALNPSPVAAVRGIDDAVIINLSAFIGDVNGDINYSTLSVVTGTSSTATWQLNQPSAGFITINYTSSQRASDFVGLDSLRISVADGTPTYSTARVTVDRQRNLTNPSKDPEDIEVHNAISPDGDGVNDFMRINFLSDYENTVSIYDRWGSKVWEGKNYNNTTVRFEGKGNVASTAPLPDGTYFFVIKNESKEYNGEKNGLTSGYLVISRQKE